MIEADDIEFFHGPQTRSSGIRLLFAELGVRPRMTVLTMTAGEHLGAAYRSVNPMGKVPAIRHRGQVVTEQVAIFLYLADLFPDAGLAPAITDPLRGPYLRWMVFYAACLEPAMVDRAMQREPGRRAMSPYGDFETMMEALLGQLRHGPWMLGERFTAADVLWGTALGWMTRFGMIPAGDEVRAYLERFRARTQFDTVMAAEAEDAARIAA